MKELDVIFTSIRCQRDFECCGCLHAVEKQGVKDKWLFFYCNECGANGGNGFYSGLKLHGEAKITGDDDSTKTTEKVGSKSTPTKNGRMNIKNISINTCKHGTLIEQTNQGYIFCKKCIKEQEKKPIQYKEWK